MLQHSSSPPQLRPENDSVDAEATGGGSLWPWILPLPMPPAFWAVWAVVVKTHGCPDGYEQEDTKLHDGTMGNTWPAEWPPSPDCLPVHVCGG